MHINNFTQHQQDEKRGLGKLMFLHTSFKSDIEYMHDNGRRIEVTISEISFDKLTFNIRYIMIYKPLHYSLSPNIFLMKFSIMKHNKPLAELIGKRTQSKDIKVSLIVQT